MYASAVDLVAAWGQDAVTRLSVSDADPAGAATLTAALAYAQAIVDAQLSVRFALPLPAVPQVLTDVAVDLAIERMANSADKMTEIIGDRGKRARGDLKQIAEGRMNLGLPLAASSPGEGGALASPRPVVAQISPGVNKLFSRDTLRAL